MNSARIKCFNTDLTKRENHSLFGFLFIKLNYCCANNKNTNPVSHCFNTSGTSREYKSMPAKNLQTYILLLYRESNEKNVCRTSQTDWKVFQCERFNTFRK